MKRAIVSDEGTPSREQLIALMPKLLVHAKRLTQSNQNAEDLVQDTCLRAIDRMSQWTGDGRFDAWVAKIMESIWFNNLRAVRRRNEEGLDEANDIGDNGFEGGTNARLILSKLRDQAVISEEDFALITKICLYGYSYKEIASEDDVPIGTILSRVSRAKTALRSAVTSLHKEVRA